MLRRHQTWYVRVRIPSDLTPFLGTQLVRTLRTSDRRTAQARAVGLVASLSGLFMDIRKTLVQQIADVRDGTADVSDLKAFVLAHADTIGALPPEDLRNVKMMLNLLVTQEARDNSERKQTLELARLSAWFARDAHQKGMIEGLQKALLSQQVTPTPSKPDQKKYPDVPWMNLIAEFYKDNPGYSEDTRKNYTTVFRDFEALVTNKYARDLTKADLKKYADYLRDKPSSHKPNQTLSHTTINKNLGSLKVFLKWCINADYLEDKSFDDIKPRAKTQNEKLRRQEDIRRAFTDRELTLFFNSPLFDGYKSRASRSTPGYTKDKLPDFWFFVTMALTGARTEEICMAPSKLYDLDGIPCLDLRASGTKMQNSPRLIPILPQLQKVGFLNYAREQERKGLKLIPYPNANVQDEADAWSKRLNRYIDDIGIDKDNLVCYSFRHTFRQMLRVSGINHEIVNKIFGHETGEVGSGYGSNLSKSESVEFIDKVKLPIDLIHLYNE
ncbi:hypothetical protein CO710_10655 [Acetobacter orleanensis]|nr:DUF6538 domain-containing protein [Acetobacter orleanensis]PCD78782.1 hypothetical protein CO710_10655 [Acetobacter orleanensis]